MVTNFLQLWCPVLNILEQTLLIAIVVKFHPLVHIPNIKLFKSREFNLIRRQREAR